MTVYFNISSYLFILSLEITFKNRDFQEEILVALEQEF